MLLFLSLPLILTFLFVALFRHTLPHWTGPAYLSLMLIAAVYMGERFQQKLPVSIKSALILIAVFVGLGVGQINFGIVNTQKFLANDPTLDMFGWKQLNRKIKPLFKKDSAEGSMPKNAPIISWRWFPAAHLDLYVAKPNGKVVKAIGSLERIHKYAWMNKQRGGFKLGMDAYFITFSNDYEDPSKNISKYFETVQEPDTIAIERSGIIVKEAYIYRLKNLIEIPTNALD